MKKFFLMLAMVLPVCLFSGCSDDEEDTPVVGSYQITNLVDKYSDDDLNGTMYNCVVVEFDADNEAIKQDYVGSIPYGGGVSQVIETDPSCKNVVVTFFYLPDDDIYDAINRRVVVVNLYEIRSGETTLIQINEHTRVEYLDELSTVSLTKSLSSVGFEISELYKAIED